MINTRLMWSYLRALLGDYAEIRRAIAYRYYLSSRYPSTCFDAGCIVDDNCSFGEGVHVAPRTHLSRCKIDRYSSVGGDSHYNNCEIGSFCSLGPQVLAGLGKHPTDYVSTSAAFYSSNNSGCQLSLNNHPAFDEYSPIFIGHDVWIGARVLILDGIRIGHGAIIGAGAVVTHNVQPYSIVGGVPAKEIKKRFSNEIIEQLLDICWWNRSIEWIREYAVYFTKVEFFLNSVTKS